MYICEVVFDCVILSGKKGGVDFMKVKHNIARIEFLLSLYKMTKEELLLHINLGLKKPITAK